MSNNLQIKQFVQQVMGCTCPEEVFSKIHYQAAEGSIWNRKINVGDRLLIYIVTGCKASGIERVINTALKQGVEERDRKALNRFRLVLVSPSPDELRGPAEKVFNSSEYSDEKSHLHIIGGDEAAEVL